MNPVEKFNSEEAKSTCQIGGYFMFVDENLKDMAKAMFSDTSWGLSDNPQKAVWKYLMKTHSEFYNDKSVDHTLLVSIAPYAFLNLLK